MIGAPALAACVIVKDAAATLEACLASVRPFVDEVNVYDTGSTDGTLDLLDRLAGEPGPPLRVERGEWRDDFAWARERSFAMASPGVEWLVWIDSDDVLNGGRNLRPVIGLLDEGVDYLVAAYIYGVDEEGRVVAEMRERVIRRSAGLRWYGRVHERLEPPAGRELAFAVANPKMLRWEHRTRRRRGSSTDRNWRLLQLELAAANGDVPASVLWDVARTVKGMGLITYAEQFYRRFLAATEGSFSLDRLRAFEELATCRAAQGDRASVRPLLELRAAEEQAWEEAAAAGRAGAMALSPSRRAAMAQALEESRPASLGRNDPCWCRSGLKLKRCHGEPPWEPILVRPAEVLDGRR